MKSLGMRKGAILAGLMACMMIVGGQPTVAQGQQSVVISVNDRAVTQYELTQRIRLLEVFRTPGDLPDLARNELIEDRLKEQEVARFGLTLSPEELDSELTAFAERANLTLPQFQQVLAQNGIDAQSLADYVEIRIIWRNYVRARFNREVSVTDADVERALAQRGTSPTELQVLLNEIIIAVTPQNAARANEVAGRIANIRSFSEFENAARQASALPSRERGGRLDWLPITNYPPQLRGLLLDLDVGEVTDPIEIPNGIALFQKRGQREARRSDTTPVSIDYAAYYIAGGQSDAARARAAQVARNVDTCDDLYGIARDQDASVLDREVLAPSDISSDVAIELARLDPGEVSYNLTANNGETLVFLMLCARNAAGAEDANPSAVRNQIRSQRLAALADALVEDLRASAVIRQ